MIQYTMHNIGSHPRVLPTFISNGVFLQGSGMSYPDGCSETESYRLITAGSNTLDFLDNQSLFNEDVQLDQVSEQVLIKIKDEKSNNAKDLSQWIILKKIHTI